MVESVWFQRELSEMDKFTWISAYKEIAAKLRAYKDRQQELIKILSELQGRGLPTISLTDKNVRDDEIPVNRNRPLYLLREF